MGAAFRSSSVAPTTPARRRAVELKAEEWFRCPADAEEIAQRMRAAVGRGTPHQQQQQTADRVESVEYEQMLHDSLTGLPTLPVMIERSRNLFKERGELVVLYLNFVRYSKIEEIYGWEKLDAVLETTAAAVREFLDDTSLSSSRVMVSFTNDDDFIFFHVPAAGVAAATENEITDMVARLQRHVGSAHRSAARRRHRGAVRHLRRPRARLLQPEDPSRAADLSRHSRGGERVALDRGARAGASRRRPAHRACAIAACTSTITRSSSPRRRRSSATRRSRAA